LRVTFQGPTAPGKDRVSGDGWGSYQPDRKEKAEQQTLKENGFEQKRSVKGESVQKNNFTSRTNQTARNRPEESGNKA